MSPALTSLEQLKRHLSFYQRSSQASRQRGEGAGDEENEEAEVICEQSASNTFFGWQYLSSEL